MCWSFKVSLFTFLIAIFAASYLWFRNKTNDRFFSVYIFVVGLMQGVEALGWYSIDTDNKDMNKISGGLTEFVIYFQIISLHFYLYLISKNSIYLCISLLAIGLWIYQVQQKKIYYVDVNCKNKNEACHMTWSWLSNNFGIIRLIYLILLTYPLFYFINDIRSKIILIFSFLTYLYSIYSYSQTNTWGSFWCWTVNLSFPFLLYFS
jgi:hypothetical protein